MNVVYCCSDLFAEVCGVSIVSLFENNKHFSAIHVYIVDDGISQANKARLNSIAAAYNRDISFITMQDPRDFYHDARFALQILGHNYARLTLGDILPQELSRVISLDSDTLVLDKLDELRELDLSERSVAGVDDCMGRVALVKTQHLKGESRHCNAGMLVFNLETWRKENWTELFYRRIKGLFDAGTALGGYEEEVINFVLNDRIQYLPPRYNLMTLEQVLSYDEVMLYRRPLRYYSREEIEEAKRSPAITHATNLFYVKKRIYEENSDHPMRGQYVKYRALTPWADQPAMAANPTAKQKLMKDIWHWMPRRLALYTARFVRDEVRPLLAKKRDDV